MFWVNYDVVVLGNYLMIYPLSIEIFSNNLIGQETKFLLLCVSLTVYELTG